MSKHTHTTCLHGFNCHLIYLVVPLMPKGEHSKSPVANALPKKKQGINCWISFSLYTLIHEGRDDDDRCFLYIGCLTQSPPGGQQHQKILISGHTDHFSNTLANCEFLARSYSFAVSKSSLLFKRSAVNWFSQLHSHFSLNQLQFSSPVTMNYRSWPRLSNVTGPR